MEVAIKGCSALIADKKLTLFHSVAYDRRGEAYAHRADYKKAISDYSKVIELSPSNALAWTVRGTAYDNSGEYDLALADLNQGIKLDLPSICSSGLFCCDFSTAVSSFSIQPGASLVTPIQKL